jgi:mono/diheme cytochrome c family protein
MMRLLKLLIVLALLAAVIGGAMLYPILSRGIRATDQPTWLEVQMARTMRHLAVPSADRTRTNPVPASAEVVEAGMAHFADHCAVCHANDGSGDTEMGRNLYPKPPDMRTAITQSLSDGELFAIIEHGVRLTGMPAWGNGTPDGEHASWQLVRFIRQLPKLTPDDIVRMASMNPKSPDEFREEEEERRFLEGQGDAPVPDAAKPHHH